MAANQAFPGMGGREALRTGERKPNSSARKRNFGEGGQCVPRKACDLTVSQRAKIFEMAERLYVEGKDAEISHEISVELNVTERIVGEVLVGFALQHRTECINYESNMRNLRGLAKEAGRSVWDR
jgi:hypothetical protein